MLFLCKLENTTGKPFSHWISAYFCSILNGVNIYFDTVNEPKEYLPKIRRDYKREIETSEKFNLDNLKLKAADFNLGYETIVNNFEQDLKSNKNQEAIQDELKFNLKLFYAKLFPKTCIFTVNKSSKPEVNNFKLISLHLNVENNDNHFKKIITFLLKYLNLFEF